MPSSAAYTRYPFPVVARDGIAGSPPRTVLEPSTVEIATSDAGGVAPALPAVFSWSIPTRLPR
jgi:hypothetical protein